MNRNIFLLCLASLLSLSSCTLAPEYTRPENPAPAEWPTGPAYQEAQLAPGTSMAIDKPWREFFTDERLRTVIEMSLNNNRDLRAAMLNVDRARAFYGIQRAELFPVINAFGGGSKQRTAGEITGEGNPRTTEQYSANLGVSAWELDFFGRLQSLKNKALEEYLATEQASRSAQVLLVSAVANSYLTLAADREGLKLAQDTLAAEQSTFNMRQRSYNLGLASELTLRQTQTRLEAARVDVGLYTRLVALDENALTLLVGTPVSNELLPVDLSSISPQLEVSAGVSSEVLLRRPDILQAENLLKAANANIGAARAAFFPRISLTTAIGTASGDLSGLFKSGTDTWNFTPHVVLPIFDARLWSAAEAVSVENKIALAQYEKAIQIAFREVADALATQGTVEQQLTAQQSLVNAVADTYRLSNVRYDKGIDSFLGVLDAQRSLYAAQQGLIAIRLLKLANQVRFYAVLGGGSY